MRLRTIAFAVLAFLSSPSWAVPTFTFNFSSNGLTPTQHGSFTLTTSPTYNGGFFYSLVSLNYSIGSTVWNTTNTTFEGIAPGIYVLGDQAGPLSVAGGTDDFFFLLNAPDQPGDQPGNVTGSIFWYASANTVAVQQGSVVVSAAPPVPEPATWGMMLIGFLVSGAALRGKRIRGTEAEALN